ncbi:MAG: dephospho-CoA kinase [Bryobacteraceae bacterium]|nr:dephospho-CoA kinase [Bryobacteraceae bacterium]MCX7605023.1 dephospho-CoA kinase [Bryobacteraceae bacterium]
MLRVGLTGGLASGKSFVGEALASLGCHLLKADELGHRLLMPGTAVYDRVVAEFGPSILDAEGRIQRRALGSVVFADPERLARLNAIVHPAVIEEEERWMQRVAAEDPHGIAVVEAAILIETGSYRRFDRIVLAVCAREQQIERAMKRDGLSREEALQRLERQMPLEEKKKFADFIIDTSGEKEQTLAQVRRLYEELRRLAA